MPVRIGYFLRRWKITIKPCCSGKYLVGGENAQVFKSLSEKISLNARKGMQKNAEQDELGRKGNGKLSRGSSESGSSYSGKYDKSE